ncbi:hypothetical protein AXG93_319s1090 [Marchantia polymorpha subsp. ruderalis]|uniref:Uncharacterized protein n=1 Tax=Marchantia polymorpha subsp. ruderalis TaxID=1480154 RepID=A0A176W4L1_MARPO|nr:hypothetical protein AXG93_319s1090 [Marchantia polymorpha subsp. ruderalis]
MRQRRRFFYHRAGEYAGPALESSVAISSRAQSAYRPSDRESKSLFLFGGDKLVAPCSMCRSRSRLWGEEEGHPGADPFPECRLCILGHYRRGYAVPGSKEKSSLVHSETFSSLNLGNSLESTCMARVGTIALSRNSVKVDRTDEKNSVKGSVLGRHGKRNGDQTDEKNSMQGSVPGREEESKADIELLESTRRKKETKQNLKPRQFSQSRDDKKIHGPKQTQLPWQS